jgi:hypothetical protein
VRRGWDNNLFVKIQDTKTFGIKNAVIIAAEIKSKENVPTKSISQKRSA